MPNPKDAYDKALSLSKHSDRNFWELAQCLATLHTNPELWTMFIKKSGISRRKAFYLLKVHQRFAPLKLSKSRIQKIGWTKAMIIANYINPEKAGELLSLAGTHTAQQLKAILRGDPIETTQHCMTLYFNPEQYAELEPALIANGASRSRRGRGLTNKEEAIITIIRKAQHWG
jgi:hypothetical protein